MSDVVPGAQDVEMLLNISTADEVTVGASLSDSLPWEDQSQRSSLQVKGSCLADLLATFIDPDIMNKDVYNKRKLPNGKLEEGEGSGVFRDCLSEFWGEFYKCT